MWEEMGLTHLQQILRSICYNSQWKYAVFWKLKHRARMMLTWEDAYYANEALDPLNKLSNRAPYDNLHDGRYLQDTLGLAVAKMSYLVYSLGEGIIGQAAVTGKHQWIFADKQTSRFLSSSEYCDGWQTQFSAGIKTIAVVAVVPHGVVQLGSLHTVTEDIKLVTHIKDVFFSLQNSSMKTIHYSIPCTTESSPSLSGASTRTSGSEVFNNFPPSTNTASISHRKIDAPSYPLPSTILDDVLGDILALPTVCQAKQVEGTIEHVGVEASIMRNSKSTPIVHTESVILNSTPQKKLQRDINNQGKCQETYGGRRNVFIHSGQDDVSIQCNYSSANPKSGNFMLPLDEFVSYPSLPSSIPDLAVEDGSIFDKVYHLQKELPLPKSFEMGTESEVSCTDTMNKALRFSAGCELHEALGPAFKKQQDGCSSCGSDRTEAEIIAPPVKTASSLFTTDCGSEYLLEAVVAKTCTLSSNTEGGNSLCKSAESLLTTGKTSETSNQVKHCSVLPSGSVVPSVLCVEDAHKNLKLIWDQTEVCNLISPMNSSSKALSTSSKHSETQTGSAKGNRKRARPGESCRPRPRDRQLIQDRVKELRELVPSGSKCSIDSLLERTIKHMFFLQSVTQHADKLRKCTEPKFRDNKMSFLGSCNHEHGSSWALDVGGQAEVCPLVVENLNMDGQMLVEMLCEECTRFLEIAEAIRSLGLTILKGVTESRSGNVWACFVVEGQNKRSMHRMDVLWCLMQLMQPSPTV